MNSARAGDRRRDAVNSVATPGMTTRQPPGGQGGSPERSVPHDCVQGVLRAGGIEAAPQPQRTEQGRQHWRDDHTIAANSEDQNMLGGVQTASLSSLARRSVDNKSPSTWAKLFPTMDCLATKTKSRG